MLAVIPFINHAVMWLEAVAMVVVQALDAAIELSIKDPFKTIGPHPRPLPIWRR